MELFQKPLKGISGERIPSAARRGVLGAETCIKLLLKNWDPQQHILEISQRCSAVRRELSPAPTVAPNQRTTRAPREDFVGSAGPSFYVHGFSPSLDFRPEPPAANTDLRKNLSPREKLTIFKM